MMPPVSGNTALLLDIDGTLLDSATQIILAVQETRSKYNLTYLQPSEIFELIGMPAHVLFNDHKNPLEDKLKNKVVQDFRNILETKYMSESILFPGAKYLITNLINSGMKIGVATSKPTYLAKSAIKNSELKNLPISIQGTDNIAPKPDPTVILNCIKILQTRVNVMIGDRTEDIQAGKNANCLTIGLTQSSHSKEELTYAGADLVLPSLDSITILLINKILGEKH
jgi:phosphoglycolate phosphatase